MYELVCRGEACLDRFLVYCGMGKPIPYADFALTY